jgi:hypothetical protein
MTDDNYRILTQDEADSELKSFNKDIAEFLSTKSQYLLMAKTQFINNSLVVDDWYAYFYGTLKIHKNSLEVSLIDLASG